jgi:hypothetical protein
MSQWDAILGFLIDVCRQESDPVLNRRLLLR